MAVTRVEQYKKRTYDLSSYVQITDGNLYDNTVTFRRRKRAQINVNQSALSGTCNGIKANCNSFEDLTLTIDQKISVNEKYTDCDFSSMSTAERKNLFTEFVKDWTEAELRMVFTLMKGTDITDELEADTTVTNIYDEIVTGVGDLMDQGYRSDDIVLVLNQRYHLEMKKLDLACCDMAVRTGDQKSTLAQALEIKQAISIPADVISGNTVANGGEYDGTAETTIKFRMYAYSETKFGASCKRGIDVRSLSGDEVGEQIIGDELIGFSQFNTLNSEVHAYMKVTEAPEA